MGEMLITIGIVLLIIIVIGLIVSIFANITLGTPTPVNVLVKPISEMIGNTGYGKRVMKKAAAYEETKKKNVKTYELNKEKEVTKDKVKEVVNDHVKENKPTFERTIDNREVTKSEGKVKELKK